MPLPRPRPRDDGARFDVVGLGEISVDDVLLIAGTPAWGGKARVARRERLGGGQVATAMVALSRLGLRTAIIGAVGDDAKGRFAIEGLRAEGVDVSGVRVAHGDTRDAIIAVDERGERTVFYRGDARLALGPRELDAALIASARVLHVDGNDPRSSLAAARIAREAGVIVSCDLDHQGADTGTFVDASPPHLIRESDVCILAASCFRVPENALREDWLGEKLRSMASPAGRVACVTLGAEGALASEGGETVSQPAFRVEPVVDTTACGDTFRAGFVAALLDGRDLRGCLRFACAAAALKVRDIGRRGCPTRGEVDTFLSRHS